MIRKVFLIHVLLSLTFLTVLPVQAQRHFGIIWDPPATERDAARELFQYQQLGIRTLMIEGIHDLGIVDVLHGFDFDVVVNIPQPFLTASRLADSRPAVLDLVIRHLDYYHAHDFVSGFILFNDGQTNSNRFTRMMGTVINEFRTGTALPLFYVTGNPGHTFRDERPDGMIIRIRESDPFPAVPVSAYEAGSPGETSSQRHRGPAVTPDLSGVTDTAVRPGMPGDTASAGEPAPTGETGTAGMTVSADDVNPIPVAGFIWVAEQGFDIRRFQDMLMRTQPYGDIPVFLHKFWVGNHLKDGLEDVLIAYAGDSDAVFPNPRPSDPPPAINWHIILLLLIWISFALHYAFFPTYNKSLIRYFTHHQFFIDDIFERRIRLASTPFYVNLQTALIFGLFFHALYSYYLNSTGTDVLRHYLFLPEWIHPSVMIFIVGVIFSLIYNAIMTIWVFAPTIETQWANPAAVTYIWPQHILLPVITLMITVHISGAPSIIFNSLAVLFLLIWLSSFYIAAFNMRRYAERKTLYDILSWGLQVFVIGFLSWWVLYELGLRDVLQLAAFVN